MEDLINNVKKKELIFLDSNGRCYSTSDETVLANFEISQFRSMLELLSLNPNLSQEDFQIALGDPVFRTVMSHLIQNQQEKIKDEKIISR